MKLSLDILKKLLRAIQMTRPDEISCDECFAKMQTFAEMELAGKSPSQAMPLVEDHLKKCNDCREEYQALLIALKELQASNQPV